MACARGLVVFRALFFFHNLNMIRNATSASPRRVHISFGEMKAAPSHWSRLSTSNARSGPRQIKILPINGTRFVSLYSAICSARGATWNLYKTRATRSNVVMVAIDTKACVLSESRFGKSSVSLYKTFVHKCDSCSPGSSVQMDLLAVTNTARLCFQCSIEYSKLNKTPINIIARWCFESITPNMNWFNDGHQYIRRRPIQIKL